MEGWGGGKSGTGDRVGKKEGLGEEEAGIRRSVTASEEEALLD